jgi:hypothetical protein
MTTEAGWDTLTKSEYETLRGPLPNGNGHAPPEPESAAPPAAAVPAPTCEECAEALSAEDAEKGRRFCSGACRSRHNGRAGAFKANGARPKPALAETVTARAHDVHVESAPPQTSILEALGPGFVLQAVRGHWPGTPVVEVCVV